MKNLNVRNNTLINNAGHTYGDDGSTDMINLNEDGKVSISDLVLLKRMIWENS